VALIFAVSLAALLLLAPLAAAAPGNDAFADAVALSPAPPVEVSGSNFEAGKESGEPDHAGDPGGHSVWYSWTPTASGPVGIRLPCFGGFETLVAVYTGGAVDSLTPVASSAGLPPSNCFGESAEVEFTATAGTTYRIAVDGKGGAQGSFNLTLSGTPPNDDFAAASTIAADPPQDLFGTTKFAGAEGGEPDHVGEPGGHSVWFSWTPSTSGPISISTCSPFGNLDSLLAVYTGSSLGALMPVAANDDGSAPGQSPECRWTDSEVRFVADAGTTYRIAVDGASETVGRFNLRLRGRPLNDGFSSPRTIGPGLPSYTSQTTNAMATKEPGEPDHAGDPGGHSVWYSWTPTGSGRALLSTCNHESGIDTVLAVYTGADLGSLTPVASNDDGADPSCRPSDSEVTLDYSAGTTYRIAVDSKNDSQGRFDLNLEAPAPNDDFSNAQPLGPALPVFASGSTKFAGKQPGEPDHAGAAGGHSVWYSWTAPSAGEVTISACAYVESAPAPLLAVYTGAAVGALTPVASAAATGSGCSGNGAAVQFAAAAGTTYRIAVDGQGGGGGFALEIQGPPANDDFATPEVLGPNPMTTGGQTRLATKQPGEPDHAGDAGGHSLWFSWTPASTGPIDLTACGNSRELDTLLAVYTGADLGSLTEVAANDDTAAEPASELCDSSRGASLVEFTAVAGTTYRIAVDGKGGGTGQFVLAFEPAAANDDFDAPQTLFAAGLPSFGSANTKLATKEPGEPDHAGDPGGHSVWFSWTPTTGGPIEISTCSQRGDLDTLLAVYTGTALNSLDPVVSNDDGSNPRCRATDASAQFTATAGTTYRIAVDGKGGSSGGFQLILEGLVANDDFAKPQSLGGALPATALFSSNRFATKQAGEPDHAGDPGGASVWFKWTAPLSGPVSVDTCGSNIDTLLAVYTGKAVGSLTPVQSNDDGSGKCAPASRLSFDAVANTVYKIAVDGKAGAQGSIQLEVDARPGNDDFGTATALPGSLGIYWPGSTRLATKQPGEPDHAGDAGGHSVWFSWTPSKSAAVEFDACTGTFDPLFAIYTGGAVGALTPVATSDAGTGECEEGGRSVAFDAVAGSTYRLAIDGAGGDSGHFELHLRPAIAHPRSLAISRAGDGSGSVVSGPATVACDSSCSYAFEVGELVTLSAEPAPGSSFAGWSGGGCSGTGPCQVTLNADATVVASFSAATPAGGSGDGAPPAPPASAAPAPTPPAPTPRPPAKPLRCKPHFKKVRVHGKLKCVRNPTHRHRSGGR
jgi:hypothetical protein